MLSLEKEMAAYSSTLAWRIPWTEKPGRLQSVGSQRVRHDWATSHTCYRYTIISMQFQKWSTTSWEYFWPIHIYSNLQHIVLYVTAHSAAIRYDQELVRSTPLNFPNKLQVNGLLTTKSKIDFVCVRRATAEYSFTYYFSVILLSQAACSSLCPRLFVAEIELMLNSGKMHFFFLSLFLLAVFMRHLRLGQQHMSKWLSSLLPHVAWLDRLPRWFRG